MASVSKELEELEQALQNPRLHPLAGCELPGGFLGGVEHSQDRVVLVPQGLYGGGHNNDPPSELDDWM
jgi:hypothetical protein